MKKQIAVNAVIYLVCMIGACLLNLAVSWLLVKLADSFVELTYFAKAIVRILSAFLTMGAVLGAVVYRECYKSLEYRPGWLSLSVGLAGLGHLLLCLMLMFYPFIAGGVRYLAGVISLGSNFVSDDMVGRIYLWEYLLAFGIYLVFEIAVALIGGAMGKRMRLKGREQIKGYYDPSRDE